MGDLTITYQFHFPNKRIWRYEVVLDAETLEPVTKIPDPLPDWTALEFHQCPNCPLSVDTHPHCPLAVRIVDVVAGFDQITSFEATEVVVETPDRKSVKTTSAQLGASALMGLVMATSGCPHTEHFKPMAAHHLPLANVGETIYRAASMYMLAQYYVKQAGGEPDLNMDGLRKIYENIEVLNVHMAARVRAAIHKDAAVNAIVILDFFAKNITSTLNEKLLELAPLFSVYTE